MKHPVVDYLLVSAACDINDKHNQKMLAEGRYIPWWKRHLLFVIFLGLMAPFILVGAFIVIANNTSVNAAADFGTFLGWAIPIGLFVGGLWAYRRADQRWKREANKPTKVVSVRRGP
jgi:hypothetical protein